MKPTPKAQYAVCFRTGAGAVYAVPVSMDIEIGNVESWNELHKTVASYAVGQGFTRSLDDITITSLSLLNPNRDVDIIANEMLEKMFVEMYEQWPSNTTVASAWSDMYNSIKGIEEVNNG